MPRACRVRRELLAQTTIMCIGAMLVYGSSANGSGAVSRSPGPADGASRKRYAAIAFDYFVLFNPDSVVSAVDRVFPGRGRAFTDIWRTRQFEYSWLRSMTGRYVDFAKLTEDAMVYAANAAQVELTAPQKRAGLTTLFDALISTDANHTYKPDPRAYQLGVDDLRLAKQDIVFAAFGGWDAAGAKSFGYPTVWVNRFNQPAEELGVRPDRTVRNLKGLLDFVLNVAPGG